VRVLVVNPGSSTLKLGVLDENDAVVEARDVAAAAGEAEAAEVDGFLRDAPAVDAAGVRFAHGGTRFRRSLTIDSDALAGLEAVADLAPLHNPPALTAVRALRRVRPTLPVVACFDTSFFTGLPPAAATYALPRRWIEDWGMRRFGFHGLSHAWAGRRATALLGRPAGGLRVVTCHLGAGASLAALADGSPFDTTMGFTPLDGLVMATRSGAVDPGILLWAQREHGLSVEDLERVLDRESGLLGLSGLSGDMRAIVDAADRGDAAAALAFAVYLHRLRGSVAAMAAALGGVDAVVFTGGVGQHSARVRAECCDGLAFLGLMLDHEANAVSHGPDRDISSKEGRVRILVVEAREDVEIAREVRRLIDNGRGS
jgi:acetate kinase